jgi:hypothetical protein
MQRRTLAERGGKRGERPTPPNHRIPEEAMSQLARRALLAVGSLVFAAAVAAQSPAVSPQEADMAKAQQERQVTQPLNNQPVWSEIRSGAPQVTTVRGRETNILIQPEGQTWRAVRVPLPDARRDDLRDGAGRPRGVLFPARPDDRARAARPADPALLAQGPLGALAARDRLGRARDHRPHPVARQERAAAADRLHAVLVARDAREEPAQLHRAGAARRGAVDVRPLHPLQRHRRPGPALVHEHRRLLQGQRVPVGQVQRRREARSSGSCSCCSRRS